MGGWGEAQLVRPRGRWPGTTCPEVWRPVPVKALVHPAQPGPGRAWWLGFCPLCFHPTSTFCFHRAYGVVSMCIGTGMGAAAVFEYPGN